MHNRNNKGQFLKEEFNAYEIKGAVTYVQTVSGKVFRVDTEDLNLIRPFRWSESNGYIISLAGRLHQVLLKTKKSVDHKNGDPLDNRKDNLRIATKCQNAQNSKRRIDNTSGYKGVSLRTDPRRIKRWRACINCKGKQIVIGTYKTAEEAAEAYNRQARILFGDFARLNEVKK